MEDRIKKAVEFAHRAHAGQKRLSGEDFITHPLEIAKILEGWGLDSTTIAAGLLHDVLEDTHVTKEELTKEFGEEVANLVDGVTKITHLHFKGCRTQAQIESLMKMILVMAKDLRVIFVKLADRLHNMKTLQFLSKAKQIENAKETLEIYAPIAGLLGLDELKIILDDLSFPYAYQEEYDILLNKVNEYDRKIGPYVESLVDLLSKKLDQADIKNAKICIRKKHFYSLWSKLKRPEIDGDFEKIYDIIAIRILVNTVPECYLVLKLMESIQSETNLKTAVGDNELTQLSELQSRDFIKYPKPNGYQSIHVDIPVTIGKLVEIQIRTYKMHENAEYGPAAHWVYDLAKRSGATDQTLENGAACADNTTLPWIKRLIEWKNVISHPDEFLHSVKIDLFQERIFIFSKEGEIYDLPLNATPVDFAYTMDIKCGHTIERAKVNDKWVQLDHKLQNGDVVEIFTNTHQKGPRADWLNFVVTIVAKIEIMNFLKLT